MLQVTVALKIAERTVFERCCETPCIADEARGETVAGAAANYRERADVADEPVFADADHQQKDEADGDADYDADNDGEQETFTRHRRHRRGRNAAQYHALNHSRSSFDRPPLHQSRHISPFIRYWRRRAGRGNTGGHPLCERPSGATTTLLSPCRARAVDAFHCEPRRRATPGS